MTPIQIFFVVFVVVFALGRLLGPAALNDYLVYRNLQRRLGEERGRRTEE